VERNQVSLRNLVSLFVTTQRLEINFKAKSQSRLKPAKAIAGKQYTRRETKFFKKTEFLVMNCGYFI
jgi:hypothetical protein